MKKTLITLAILSCFLTGLGYLAINAKHFIILNEIDRCQVHVEVWPNVCLRKTEGMEKFLDIVDEHLVVIHPDENSTPEHKQAWKEVNDMLMMEEKCK